jgi:hypothetical protein
LLCSLAFGLALTPAISMADYQPAEVALGKLENIVTLTPTQQKQALEIYQNLKVVMDDMDPADRPMKGMQSRQDALAAIRAILTPDQQAVFDSTPQRLGGDLKNDPVMRALNLKIRTFVTGFARTSPEIAAQVGTVQKVVHVAGGMTESSSVSIVAPLRGAQSNLPFNDSQSAQGAPLDSAPHPQSGSNLVKVTGSSGTKTFKISWDMNDAGEMTVTKVEAATN